MKGKVKMPAKKGHKSGDRRGKNTQSQGKSKGKPMKGKVSNARAVLDHYSLQAQREGYPARSVYKLEEIQQKYKVFPREGKVLDVGAAPGSWSLYILRNLSPKGLLAAVDLKPLNLKEENDPRYHFLQGDFFDDENLKALQGWGPYDAVLSDAAPATTGNRTVDTGRSASLVEGILYQARKLLKPGGNLVVKIFLGGEEQSLLSQFKDNFSSARMFKPKACRKESFETFLIGQGFKPPGNGEEG